MDLFLWKPGKYFHQIPVQRFNRICLFLAALWLAVSVPLGIRYRPTIADFDQFYIGGALASRGNWSALYPRPIPGSLDNAGLSIHSRAKPDWTRMCRIRGVWDHTHFILPPPSALLFIPLSWMNYLRAFQIWMLISSCCVLGVAMNSSRLFRYLVRRPTRYEGLLTLLIVLSPMAARAIRIGNVTPPVALSVSVVLLSLVRRESSMRGCVAIVLGALLKYATLILLPLVVAMRRWRMLLGALALGSVTLLIALLVEGEKPFIEFYSVILPTLSRPSWFAGNQSLAGFLARVVGRPFSSNVSFGLNTLRSLSLGVVLILVFGARRNQWRNTVQVFAGAALVLSWLLVFSPIVWEHWAIFLCPIWGWLLWEAREPGFRRLASIASLVLLYFPAGIIQVEGIARYPVIFPEPFNSTQLLGAILVFYLALSRVSQRWRESSIPVPIEVVPEVGQLNAIQNQAQPKG